jgi:hypothetical protein
MGEIEHKKIDVTEPSRIHAGLGILTFFLYSISGAYQKVASAIDAHTGEIPKEELTCGEITSVGVAVLAGCGVYGLSKIVNYCFKKSKESLNPKNDVPWLFERLE